MAYLFSKFGARYKASKIFSAYYECRHKPNNPCKDVQCTLTAAQQIMYANSIPVVRSTAEDQYYLNTWSLSAA